MLTRGLAGLALAGLAACASGPRVEEGPGTNVDRSGTLLLRAAADGPIPLIVDQAPTVDGRVVTPEELTAWAKRGVDDWTKAEFVPGQGTEGTRLVYRFTQVQAFAPSDACREAGGGPAGETTTPLTVAAYLCDGDIAAASAVSQAAGQDSTALQRAVVETTRRLVPSPARASRFGPGVGMFGGVGVGSGGWHGSGGGIGIGLGF